MTFCVDYLSPHPYKSMNLTSGDQIFSNVTYDLSFVPQEMLKDLEDVIEDQYGKKVLLYLLSKRDPLHFNADIIKLLQMGDDNPYRWSAFVSPSS